MLSTRLGYFLPAFLAAALADALAAGDNGVDFFLGLGVSQTFLAICIPLLSVSNSYSA